MRRLPSVLTVALAASLALGASVPATAAGGGGPKVRVISDETIVENEIATLSVRYRCAAGHSASLFVSLWQGGTAADPVSSYNTTLTPASDQPVLICDGDRHIAPVTLIFEGWNTDLVNVPFLVIAANGGSRVKVTATLTDTTTGRVDVDHDRMIAVGR